MAHIWRAAVQKSILCDFIAEQPGGALACMLDLMEERTTASLTKRIADQLHFNKVP